MTNPTSNFGWQMPTASDLVTDLPADFETFGQAVDTSLADLKGGTTGQVLSKASNTDMDFTWVTSDDANAIQNAIVDAKGDLIAASAADTPARLAVGNNGETLVADSSTATGLRYQATQAAGRNYAINGGTDIWQRGTSFTPSAGAITQLADRWSGIRPTVAGWTVSQRNSATDSGVAGSTFFMRVQRDSGNTATQDLNIAYNNLEGQSFIPLQGQSVTISFWAKAGANYSAASSILNLAVVTGTTADTATWSVTGTTNSTTRTLTTSWQRFSYTIAFGATDKAMRTQFYYTPVGTAGANDFFDIWGLQIEVGSVATAFTKAGGTLQGELAACQRYYQLLASGLNKFLAVASVYSASQLDLLISFPEMRIAPSLVATSGTGYYTLIRNGGGDNFNSLTLNGYTTTRGAALYNNTEISSTAGNAGWVYTDNASASVALSAEL